jgi:hypothetical protein
MGGPGSGRRPRSVERVADLGDLSRMSTGPLEAMLGRALYIGAEDEATAIRAELAGRTWQHDNPYS